MNDKQKIVTFILALMCNFTFLATAQNNGPTDEARRLPECIKSHGVDSIETRRTMSVLQEDFGNKDYDYSYKWFTYMFNNAPCAYKSVYIYGQVTLNNIIDKPKYATRREGLIDTLLLLFPTRIKYFGEEGPVKAKWALNIGRYRPNNVSEALKLYEFYIESEKDKLDDVTYIRDYMRQATLAHKKTLLTKEQLFNLYDNLSGISETYKLKFAGDSVQYSNWENTIIYMDKLMLPYMKCADIDLVYQPKLKADPNNKELINKAIKFYKAAGPLCKDNLNFVALLEKSFSIEPNAVAAEELAMYFDKKKNKVKANDYYEKAAELSNDNKKKETLYMMLAERNLNTNFGAAKSYANKVLALNSNNGKAIIIQGIAIYKAKCGDKFDQAMAACAAVEMFNRAKSVDPSCTAQANAQIAQYKKFYPLKADAFFRNLKTGDSYTIPCSGITATVVTK